MDTSTHITYMQRALALARRAEGRTSPNPVVGAVIIKEGRVVGEGYHRRAGESHAEIEALRAAGEAARGATMYVTLEPCAYYGRTPPCTDALILAGVAEVYYAIGDPNPRVNGRGHAQLEAAGVIVHRSLCEEEARELNRPFFKYVTSGRPFVTAKFAMSLDGKIATRSGDSRWITGPAARRQVHQLRDQVDAILVGVNTVIADDPQLTTRLDRDACPEPSPERSRRGSRKDVRHPLRVILDSRGRIPLTAGVLDQALPGRTLVATTEAMAEDRRQALVERGVEVLVLPADEGRVSLPALLDTLGSREVTSLLVEGGGTVLGAFFAQGLVDKVLAFIAPLIIGGREAPTPVGDPGVDRLARALRLKRVQVRHLGPDLLVSGYPTREER